MEEGLKALGIAILIALGILLWYCYGFAQDHHIATDVVFEAAICLIIAAGLSVWLAFKMGLTEGFCLALMLGWASICPVLSAIAKVNAPPAFRVNFDGQYEEPHPAWYGAWWFELGVGLGLIALCVYLLRRKYRY